MAHTTNSAPVFHSSACFHHINGSKRCPGGPYLKLSCPVLSPAVLRAGFSSNFLDLQDQKAFVSRRVFCTSSDKFEQEFSYPKQDQALSGQTYIAQEPMPQYQYGQMSSSGRRRPYNLEAKMRMKAYRRQALQQQRANAIAEEARTFQLNSDECYKQGDPNTVVGKVSEIIHIGIIVKLANGREGFLPASQLGCMGSLELMDRLFHVGQELSFRVIEVPQVGKDRLFLKR